MMARAPTKNDAEETNLGQKKRLQYVLARYAPRHLVGVELFRRLRLSDAYDLHDPDRDEQNSEKGYEKKIRAEKKRWLPDHIALRTINVGQFKQWMQLDNEPNYRPNRGFDRRTCEALGFVITEEFEHWPNGRLDDAGHEAAYRALAEFIGSGAGQPAEIFFGIRPAFAEEVTYEKREQIAAAHQCRAFLRGGIPFFGVVNSGATIRRDVESVDGRSIVDFIREDPRRMMLLTSAAGDGKTTLLFRLARTFFDRGWHVFIKRTNTGREVFDAPIGRIVDTVMMIDRAEDLGDLNRVCDWLADNPRLHIIVAARDMEWRNLNFETDDGRFRHVFIDRLSDREIEETAKAMQKFKAADDLVSLDELKSRLLRSVQESRHPHMLAAVMSATRDKDFSEILNSMIEHFEPKELLKLTALGATMRFADGHHLYCTSNMMWATQVADVEEIGIGRERFERIHRKVRSEIVSIGANRYDLRHPDITQFVLRKSYSADPNGVFEYTDALESDLYRLIRAVHRIRIFESLPYHRLREFTRYLYRIPQFWWESPATPNHEVGRKLFQDVYRLLGTAQSELSIRATLLQIWMRLEHSLGENPVAMDVQRQWLPVLVESLSSLKDRSEDLFDAKKWSFYFALQDKGLGNFVNPEPGTARRVWRDWWNFDGGRFQGGTLLGLLIKHDREPDVVGQISDPAPYSLRWLYRSMMQSARLTRSLVTSWANFENTHDNVGGDFGNPEAYSARWIFRYAWEQENREKLCGSQLMTDWAELEAEKGELGDLNGQPQFSARWILRKAWESADNFCGPHLMTHWAALEAEKGELGGLDGEPQFSARWIFQRAWESADKLCDSQLMTRWAELEAEKGELGDLNGQPQFSARWILRQAWEQRGKFCSPELLFRWGLLETDKRQSADRILLDKYSPRWIFRQAWDTYAVKNVRFFDAWIRLEIDAKNFGDQTDVPETYSARWALQERAKIGVEPRINLLWNARIAAEEGNIGEFDDPRLGTAREIFRRLYQLGAKLGAYDWIKMEQSAPDHLSNEGKRFSAEWIFNTVKPRGDMTLDEWLYAQQQREIG